MANETELTQAVKQVVIVGGGFAGVRSALQLANHPDFKVTLISKQTYFEYHAALFRSATGRSPLEVAIPLADFFANDDNITVVQDAILQFKPEQRVVIGQDQMQYHYDELILALGSVTEYFDIPGLAELSFSVKTLNEALKLKRRLHEDLTAKSIEKNYVVVGGGATGVELAGELVSYLTHVRQRHGVLDQFRVHLVESNERVLPNLPTMFVRPIEQHLAKLGIQLHLNRRVQNQSLTAVGLPDMSISSHTVIWTAGMKNHPFFEQQAGLFKTGAGGRVVVNDYLESHPHVYVLGDSALTQFSGMAQTALHDADFVTKNLKRTVKQRKPLPYEPRLPIYAIPVGRHWSAVLWGTVTWYGYFGWLLRRSADLSLYLRFLPFRKALTTWKYGFMLEEDCSQCK